MTCGAAISTRAIGSEQTGQVTTGRNAISLGMTVPAGALPSRILVRFHPGRKLKGATATMQKKASHYGKGPVPGGLAGGRYVEPFAIDMSGAYLLCCAFNGLAVQRLDTLSRSFGDLHHPIAVALVE